MVHGRAEAPAASGVDHYAQTRTQFDDWAVSRLGYYDAGPQAPRGHSIWQKLVRREVRALSSLVEVAEGGAVLEVGCGRGDLLEEVAASRPRSWSFTGADFSTGVLGLARRVSRDERHFRFVASDARTLPFEDRTFDLTIMVNALHHVDPRDQAEVLRELARVARSAVLLEIKNAGSLYYARLYPRCIGSGIAVFPTTIPLVRSTLGRAGLRLRESRGIFHLGGLSPLVLLLFDRGGSS